MPLRTLKALTLTPILQPSPTPDQAALRQLLFAFPFLPIDAGSGADRVIGEFARQYVLSNPQAVREMRLGGRVLDELPSSSDEGDDVLDKYAGVDRLARDGVYALLYSVRGGRRE